MRSGVWVAWLACSAAVILMMRFAGPGERGLQFAAALRAAEKEGEKPQRPPPLVISKDAPRLADEPAKPPDSTAAAFQGPVANNASCYCCHTNYQEESFVQYHAKANVGCMECHGESLAHRNDEDNVTPPDVIFAADDIERNCRKCHDTHDAPAAKVVALWQDKCPARTDPRELLCTDCHGEHRLRFRTVWWDKKTRQLAPREAGQRIKWAADLTKLPAEKQAPAEGASDQGVSPDTEMH